MCRALQRNMKQSRNDNRCNRCDGCTRCNGCGTLCPGLDFRYIAIDGPIGAGKSALAERLAARLDGRLIANQPERECRHLPYLRVCVSLQDANQRRHALS